MRNVNFFSINTSLNNDRGLYNNDNSKPLRSQYRDILRYFISREVRRATTVVLVSRSAFRFVDGIALVCTLEELKKLCDQWNNGAFNLESVGYSDMMNQKLREYDNEYFAAKALIIYSNMKWNWEREPRIETISKKNNVLVIEVSLKRGTYTDKAEAGTFFIELNKADVENVTDFRIEETTR